MIPGILLGAVGGIALSRCLLRRRAGWRHGRRWQAWHRGGPFLLRRLVYRLDLDRTQRVEVEELFIKLRERLRGLRMGGRELRAAVADAIGGPAFDRARLEQL